MKKIILLLFVIANLFIPERILASHVVGGEITYACTSTPGVYQITLVLYRDCGGIPLCSGYCNGICPQSIQIKGSNSTSNYVSFGNFNLQLVNVADVNFNSLCPFAKNICTNNGCAVPGVISPGIEKYTFSGNINIGSIAPTMCNIMIEYYQCCRSSNINNISYAPFYINTTFNKCLGQCNSSPVFANSPSVVICGGQPFVYNPAAIDPDHDSLSYEFAPALQGPDSSVTYIAPYTAEEPMPHYPSSGPFPLGISCNAMNGDIMFTPPYGASGTFIGVMVIKIKQWRNINGVPQIIGTTTRDIQMWLIVCPPDNSPKFMINPSLGSQPKYDWIVAAGQQLCFDIIAKDTDNYPLNSPPLIDTTYLDWFPQLLLNGATFTKNYTDSLRKINGPREDSRKFCWTPDSTKVSSNPWFFTVSAQDKRCPKPGIITRSFSVKVLPSSSMINASINHNYTNCFGWTFTCNTNTPSYITSYHWLLSLSKGSFDASNVLYYSNQQFSNINLSDTGKFVLKLIINENEVNEKIVYDTIHNLTPKLRFNKNIPDTNLCIHTSVYIKSDVTGGTFPYSYSWKITNQSFILSYSDSVKLLSSSASVYYYKFIATDFTGCIISDTFLVRVNPLPILVRPQPSGFCRNISTAVLMDSFYTDQPGNHGEWYYPLCPNAIHSSYIYIDSMKNLPVNNFPMSTDNWIMYKYTAPNNYGGCTNTDSAILRVFSAPITNAGSAKFYCSNDTVSKELNLIQNPSPHDGDWISKTGSFLKYFTPSMANIYPLNNMVRFVGRFTYAPNKNCYDTAGTSFSVYQSPFVNAGAAKTYCNNDQEINLNNVINATPAGGIWTGNFVTSSGNSYYFNLSAAFIFPQVNILTYTASQNYPSSFSCSASDTLNMIVFSKPALSRISGSSSVNVNSVNLFNVNNTPGSYYNWWTDNGSIISGQGTFASNILFNVTGTSSLKVTETNNHGCKDSVTKSVLIIPVTGIKKTDNFSLVNIYPNPANTELNIEAGDVNEETSIELMDVLGKILIKKTIHAKHNLNEKLDVSELARGVYFISIKVGQQQIQSKVILK